MYIHKIARASLSKKTWQVISGVVHKLHSIKGANKLVEIVIPSLDFLFQPFLPYILGNTFEIKSVLFGKLNSIPLRQMDHKIRTKKHHAVKLKGKKKLFDLVQRY